MSNTPQAEQGRIIAQIALAQPERPTSGDVLQSLNEAFRAGYDAAVRDFALGILNGIPVRGIKRQAL